VLSKMCLYRMQATQFRQFTLLAPHNRAPLQYIRKSAIEHRQQGPRSVLMKDAARIVLAYEMAKHITDDKKATRRKSRR
jgi:hypothetical protein